MSFCLETNTPISGLALHSPLQKKNKDQAIDKALILSANSKSVASISPASGRANETMTFKYMRQGSRVFNHEKLDLCISSGLFSSGR